MTVVTHWPICRICDIMEHTAVIETAKAGSAGARILCAVKENRIELIGVMILAHLLGLSDAVISQVSGMCF